MPKLPALFVATLLTASLALAIFTGGGDDELRDFTTSPAVQRFADRETRESASLPTFATTQRPTPLSTPNRAAGTLFSPRNADNLRAERPRRSVPDPNADQSADERGSGSAATLRQRNRPNDPRGSNPETPDRGNEPSYQRPTPPSNTPSQPVRPERSFASTPPPGTGFASPNLAPGEAQAPSPNDAASDFAAQFEGLLPGNLPPGLRDLVLNFFRQNNITADDLRGGGNQGGGGGSNQGNDQSPGDDANDNDDDANDDGGAGTIGDTLIPTALELVWLPIDNQACTDNAPFFTNDLYVRLDGPGRIANVTIGDTNAGITAQGGTFVIPPSTSPLPPTQDELDANPCNAFGTFLTINDAGTAGEITFSTQPAIAIANSTITTDFAPTPNEPIDPFLAQEDPDELPDPGFYARIARISTTADTETVLGEITISVAAEAGTTLANFDLTVPNDPSLWAGIPTDPDPGTDPGDGGTDAGDGGTDPGDGGTDPGDGGTDPGDGGTDPGDGGTDPGDGGTDPGDGGTDPGDGGTDPIPPESLVWLTVDESLTCSDEGASFENLFVADLYVRFDAPHTMNTAATGVTGADPIRFTGGSLAQHEFGLNTPPLPEAFTRTPCIEFDSYLSMGEALATRFFFVPPEPQTSDWGEQLSTLWAVVGTVQAQQDPAMFGDEGYYVRLARFAFPPGVSIASGQIDVVYNEFATGEQRIVTLDVTDPPR